VQHYLLQGQGEHYLIGQGPSSLPLWEIPCCQAVHRVSISVHNHYIPSYDWEDHIASAIPLRPSRSSRSPPRGAVFFVCSGNVWSRSSKSPGNHCSWPAASRSRDKLSDAPLFRLWPKRRFGTRTNQSDYSQSTPAVCRPGTRTFRFHNFSFPGYVRVAWTCWCYNIMLLVPVERMMKRNPHYPTWFNTVQYNTKSSKVSGVQITRATRDLSLRQYTWTIVTIQRHYERLTFQRKCFSNHIQLSLQRRVHLSVCVVSLRLNNGIQPICVRSYTIQHK
jgi:hypothetical protein